MHYVFLDIARQRRIGLREQLYISFLMKYQFFIVYADHGGAHNDN